MPDQELGSLQLLRQEIKLFQELGEVRSERNDIREARIREWDEHRHELTSNLEFETLWRKTAAGERDNALQSREGAIIGELKKIRVTLEHLHFAGLHDAA
ncbi:MAG: hypothetical protein ACRECO_09930 [Xanthobacteraceae bacterium]